MNEQQPKYTPGPWRVEETVGAPMVVAGKRSSAEERRISTYREIAQVRYYLGSEDVSLAEANAKLIAAAPLLLEALQGVKVCPYCTFSNWSLGIRQHMKECKLNTAIKAATGE